MSKKILIIQTAFIGDVVLATSLIENLHAAFPQAVLHFLVRKGNEALLTGHPLLQKVWVWNKQQQKKRNLLRLLRAIRGEKYDLVINVQRFAATGLLTAFSGAKQTVGFDKNPFSRLFSRRVKHLFTPDGPIVHEIERNHQLIAHLPGVGEVKKTRLYPSQEDRQRVQSYIQKPFITISPASVWFTKQYPARKWADLIDQLPMACNIYLLGGPGDRSLSEHIREMCSRHAVRNLCGELSFLQSAALMEQADMNYVNDSAPMHFASAVNAPVTVVYCSTVPAFGYGPLSDQRCIVQIPEPLYCRPCGLHGYKACPQGHFRCAMDIQTAQLLQLLPAAGGDLAGH